MQVGIWAIKCDVPRGQNLSNLGLLWAYPSLGALKKLKMGWNGPKCDFKIGMVVFRIFLSHYTPQSSHYTAHSTFSHFAPNFVPKKMKKNRINLDK